MMKMMMRWCCQMMQLCYDGDYVDSEDDDYVCSEDGGDDEEEDN